MLSVNVYAPRESFGSNMYLVESSGEFLVIDPSVDFMTVAAERPEVKHATRYIVVTHAHFDHILKLDSWREATGAEVIVSAVEGAALSDPYRNAYQIFFGTDDGYTGAYTPVSDGDELSLGDERFKIVSTPGHTAGGISVLFRDAVFVGDTVFADGGYGRYDLPGGDLEALMCSVRYLAGLDRSLAVYPGHGRATDVSELYCYFSNL